MSRSDWVSSPSVGYITIVGNQHLRHDTSRQVRERDVVYTPDPIAKEIIDRYGLALEGRQTKVLDPCRGEGAFARQIPDCLWCEVSCGVDFFNWRDPVDWIVGNPPYSILQAWLEHSFQLADHVVYLLPIAKVFGSRKRLLSIANYGGIAEVYAPWTGRSIGFEFGWACGAVYMRKGYKGPTQFVLTSAAQSNRETGSPTLCQ